MTKKVLKALVLGGCALSVFSSNAIPDAMFPGCLGCSMICAGQEFVAFNECMGICCPQQHVYYPSISEPDPVCLGMCAACVIGGVMLTQKECFGDCAETMGQIFCLRPRKRAQAPSAAVAMPAKNK